MRIGAPVLAVLFVACVPGGGGGGPKTDGGPPAGGAGDAGPVEVTTDDEGLCAAFCAIEARCDLKRAVVCADGYDEPEVADRRPDCAESGSEECQERCEAAWAANENSAACATARRESWACVFGAGCDDFVNDDFARTACSAQFAAEDRDCGNDQDQRPGECFGGGSDEACAEPTSGPYVSLDATRPTFTSSSAPAACPGGDLSRVELQLVLGAGNDTLTPGARVRGEALTDTLSADAFSFARPASPAADGEGPGVATPAEGGEPLSVELTPGDAPFSWNGGAAREGDDRLVVLALDHSGSLIGQDPVTGSVDISRGSDVRDERISFFQQLLHGLDDSAFVSLVSFRGALVDLDPEVAAPTRNRDVTREGLEALQRGEEGQTPLADTLVAIRDRILAVNEDLNPTVVLFTDGVEGRDSSEASLADVAGTYADAGIPVVVLHLQPPPTAEGPRGRDPALLELACGSGGAYLFLERASVFTESRDLIPSVRGLLRGHWRLAVDTSLGGMEHPPGGYLLATELTVRLGDVSRSVELTRSPERSDDRRAWLVER